MSHDQKPGRMRVVSGTAATPKRRRGDVAASAPPGPGAQVVEAVPSPALPAAAAARRGRLLAPLFLLGCAIGGAAVPFARTL